MFVNGFSKVNYDPIYESSDTHKKEQRHPLLAKELSQLVNVESLPHGILIKEDIEICSSNIHAFVLLQSKDVKIEGSLTCDHLFVSQFLKEHIQNSPTTWPCFLPQKLYVKGNIDFSDCQGLTHLPKDLKVGKDLKLSRCPDLIAVSQRLKVAGNLTFSHCQGLTHLPDDLEVTGDLNLFYCAALITIPKIFKVKGDLYLFTCQELTHLPEDLEVRGDCKLSCCPALTSIPKGLKVKGHLNLSDCQGLTHLPEDLEVGGDLDLSYCSALTTLPHSLQLGGHLDLCECSDLTSLPNWITHLGRRSNGNTRIIDLRGCALSPAVISRLQHDINHLEGMQFYLSEETEDEYITQFDNLFEAAQFWQEIIQEDMPKMAQVCDQLHQNLTQGQDHQNLLKFLTRLTGTADYSNIATRKDLARRVLNMLQLMTEDELLCCHMTFLIHQGLSSCDDRILATLSDMDLYQQLRAIQHESVTSEEVRSLGKGFFLLEELNKKIKDSITKLRFVDEVEVYMAFHIRLQNMLNLPVHTKNMLFRRCVAISDEEIDRVGNSLLQEITESSFEAFLEKWAPWNLYQRKASILAWEQLPVIERPLLLENCPYLQDTPELPVLYNNMVYDYNAFMKRYLDEGVDLYGTKVHIEQLFRIKTA
ncbi:NEL-type E3 ubiquitin ligase domain-containing protein [Rhabdochlamydiaceae symbiont of Dictyostelium giganteum]|uniref:NEL-type E3 ubiquitin ligase domain-containing protein n=1 Tax=Rhabdochlamydiaceae symbiont of Dictyostelium giganteum TaxID=3342349 RepID=UPI00384F0E9E